MGAVFVEDKVSNTSHLKEYMFLCPFDYVRVGDIIKDPRYVPYMQVTQYSMQELCTSRTKRMLSRQSIFLVMKSKNCSNRF